MKRTALLALAVTAWSVPAAAETCPECPRVQLLRSGTEIRIAAEDDVDAYEDLQHRVRFVTAEGHSTWTAWGDTNAYGMAGGVVGRVEAETIDLEGNVGRGVIRVTTPDEEPGTRGPGTVEEDSSTESRWEDDAQVNDGSTVASAEEELERQRQEEATSSADDWFTAQEWDHTVCPVPASQDTTEDDELGCSTAEGRPNSGLLAALIALGALVFGRRSRRI